MASTYENDLRLEEMATGENSGSWGTKTNTNLELVADAFSYGTEIIANADTAITIADGAADAARSLALKITSSEDLTTTRVITLGPNTVSKVWIIENSTSGGQTLTISAGSGTNITLANGTTKIIATDGIGAAANVVELTQDIAIADMSVDGILSLADGTNSAPSLTNTGDTNTGLYFPAADEVGITTGGTQRVKIDSTGVDITGGFTATDGSTITTSDNTTQLTLSSTDTDANVGPVLDLFRNVTGATNDELGRIQFTGTNDAGATHTFAQMYAKISDATSVGNTEDGQFSIDTIVNGTVKERIGLYQNSTVINQDAQDLDFRVESSVNTATLYASGEHGVLGIGIANETAANNLHILGNNTTPSAHILLQSDDTANATAKISLFARTSDNSNRVAFIENSAGDLTLDTTGDIILDADGKQIIFADGGTQFGQISTNSTPADMAIKSLISDEDIIFQGIDGGVGITALTLDMSEAGSATFNHDVFLPSAGNLYFTSGSSFSPRISNSNSDTALSFFTNNTERFQIATDGGLHVLTPGTSNVRLGVNAGDSITSGGNYNVFIGDEAGTACTTADNMTAVGFEALKNENTRGGSTAFGYQALKVQDAASTPNNVAVGYQAGVAVSTGVQNTIVGTEAATTLNTGNNNVAIGYLALDGTDDGSSNVAIGYAALRGNVASSNVAVGNTALSSTSNVAGNNTAIGSQTLSALTTGDKNSVVGYQAANDIITGTFNCVLGAEALTVDTKGSGSIAVGRAALEGQNFTTATTTQNTAVGNQAGLRNTTGTENTFIGGYSGRFASTSIGSTFVGTEAGLGNDSARLTGDDNTAVGRDAGHDLQGAATNNTMLGAFAGQAVTTHARNTMVGLSAGNLTNSSDNTFLGCSAGGDITTGDANTIVGRYNGNQGSLDIRTLSNNIVLSDGDGNPRMLITSTGNITSNAGNVSSFSRQNAGVTIRADDGGTLNVSRNSGTPLEVNRIGNDGNLVNFFQDDSNEGQIVVSGSTVSYNGFAGRHESSGITLNTEIGTVVSTIDVLDTYVSGPKSGQTRADHAKIKVSDTEDDKRVYGVISGYTESDNKPLVSSVGIGSVKVTGACAGGDLLESNGDGTAKVQSDDVIRSKTIGKVTIGNSDTGVKLVSCVLYCG